ELHTPGTIRHINAMVAGSAGLRRLLADEPALTMRVVSDPRGRVQSGIVALNEELLRRDMAEFGLVTIIEPSALAYALVRLGESFLHAGGAARAPSSGGAVRSSPRTCPPRASPTSPRQTGCSRPSSGASCRSRMPSMPYT